MIMRSENVPLSPSSALQTMYFCGASVRRTVLHLMPVGNPAPPRPRKPEIDHFLDDIRGRHVERAAQALQPAMDAYSSSDSGSVMPQRSNVSRC